MVLEMKVPHGDSLRTLTPVVPVFMSYVLSFIYIGIYWNNHHHMLHTVARVTGGILWANLHLLFWLSLFPFVTGWMGENHFAAVPSALYGGVLLAAAMAYWILQQTIIATQGPGSPLKAMIGSDWKGKLSPVLYVLGIGSTFLWLWVGAGPVCAGRGAVAGARPQNREVLASQRRLTPDLHVSPRPGA